MQKIPRNERNLKYFYATGPRAFKYHRKALNNEASNNNRRPWSRNPKDRKLTDINGKLIEAFINKNTVYDLLD